MKPQPTLSSLLRELSRRKPAEPTGWFRWINLRTYSMRSHEEERESGQRWQRIAEWLEQKPELTPNQESALLREAERHAWSLGISERLALAERLWDRLSPAARAKVAAGVSEPANPRRASADSYDWLARCLTPSLPVDWDGASAAQLGCNAVAFGRHGLLTILLCSVAKWGDEPVARMEPERSSGRRRWSAHLDPLSKRPIDRCLEAAVRLGDALAARMCLEAGANPDLPIWHLDRSYNERYCALSYAIGRLGWDCDSGRGVAVTRVLLEAGADASGTDYDGRNKPLFAALHSGQLDLAEELLDRGASFTGGNNDLFAPDPGPKARLKSPLDPDAHYRPADLEWARNRIGSLIPLKDAREVPNFYEGDGQGGSFGRFLSTCCDGDNVEILHRFEARGLPLELTAQDVIDFASSWRAPYRCLHYILERLEAPAEVMARIRRRCPEIGTSGLQYLCRPEPNGSNMVKNFNDYGQKPLELPDGIRYYAYFDAIAPAGHDLGPVPERHIYALTVTANYRRRMDYLITRGVRRNWELMPIPGSTRTMRVEPVQIQELLPVVMEIEGVCIWTGITVAGLDSLSWPPAWKDLVDAWTEWQQPNPIIELARERVAAQDAANVRTPPPVLTDEELDGYPRDFWPYLRRLPNGLIGVTEVSCEFDPSARERFERWAAENKTDLETFVPDPRLLKWPLWSSVPWELQPFFEYDELFGKPTARSEGRNDYEEAMIRKAVQWNNAQFIEAFRQMEEREQKPGAP